MKLKQKVSKQFWNCFVLVSFQLCGQFNIAHETYTRGALTSTNETLKPRRHIEGARALNVNKVI